MSDFHICSNQIRLKLTYQKYSNKKESSDSSICSNNDEKEKVLVFLVSSGRIQEH